MAAFLGGVYLVFAALTPPPDLPRRYDTLSSTHHLHVREANDFLMISRSSLPPSPSLPAQFFPVQHRTTCLPPSSEPNHTERQWKRYIDCATSSVAETVAFATPSTRAADLFKMAKVIEASITLRAADYFKEKRGPK